MSPAVDGVSAHEAMDSAYNQGALSSKSLLCATTLGFKQAQTSLNLAPTDLWSGRISIQENATLDDQDSTMIIKEDFSYVRHTYKHQTWSMAQGQLGLYGPCPAEIRPAALRVKARTYDSGPDAPRPAEHQRGRLEQRGGAGRRRTGPGSRRSGRARSAH
jgi:hypothetical protein